MTPEQVKTLAAYNRTMNVRLIEVCAELSDEERKSDRGAFFRSIHGTLNHILWGDGVWMNRFEGKPLDGGSYDFEVSPDFSELTRLRAQMDARIVAFADGVSPKWLSESLTWVSRGQQYTKPYWLLVTHLFNHATHHRGQLTTLLTQLGKDIGVTDLPRLV